MKRRPTAVLLLFAIPLALVLANAVLPAQEQKPPPKRPNILLIVADDMGYSDIGCFGGEMKTPNLDALAARGLRGTGFCVGPTCSVSRSMLLSGCDNHVAGFGNMSEFLGPDQKGKPGYEGHLNQRVAPIAGLLKDAGYHTYMSGKWHLGEEPTAWPAAVGFERDFTLIQGGGSHWSDMGYPNPAHPHQTFTKNGKKLDKVPDDYFSSAYFSDFMMQCIDENKADGKPFFGYLAYQAVHSPFAAPDDWLDKAKGRYDQGYDSVRAQRLARMKEMGIVAKDVVPFPRLPKIPAWDQLTAEQKKLSARRMEVYAAMLENMDFHIGRVVDHLKRNGQLDDTLIFFFSDNGAESIELLDLAASINPDFRTWLEKNWDTKPESWGRKKSICDYGPAWAQAGSVPFRMFKGYVTEGGIRSPLIIAGPGVNNAGAINPSLLHVTDLVPTMLDVAGATHPSKSAGSKLAPIAGKSMIPLIAGTAQSTRADADWIGWELFGNRAVRQGDWKLVYLVKGAGGSEEWQLFNLRADPGETNDVAKANPDRVKAMLALWDEYVRTNGVILTGDGMFKGK